MRAIIDPNTIEPFTLKPRFECNSKGVYYIDIATDKDGNTSEKPPLRLADSVELVGVGIDNQGNHYRIIQWHDSMKRSTRKEAIPKAEIGTNAGFQALQRRGITVHSGRRKRELLSDYLQTDGANTHYVITEKAGWHDKDYILPSGEIIKGDSTSKTKAQTLYNGDTSQAHAYITLGTLQEWQQQIARYMAGNSRLCLAIGTALAAPLLSILNEPNGGFHLYGDSSDGKTTAAKVALSVWGEPESLKLTWRGTDLGFSNAALARNDNMLVLDEIGEAAPRVIGKTAYSVINGKNKLQGARDGGNRALAEWKILLLSTGEYALKNYMERAGEQWEAGQAVRLPSLPATTVYGIYESLHGFTNGAALSDHLLNAIEQQHGSAGRVWIARLQSLDSGQIRAAQTAFMQTLPDDLDGQALRVARRFALVAAALELATGITGLDAGVGMVGIKQCFDDWLAINGTGKQEDQRIIERTIAFMQQYADSMRFVDWHSSFTNSDHAGFRREKQEPNDCTEYWTIPSVFENEILQGFDNRKACMVLCKVGWLKRNGTRFQFQKFNKGRFYVLKGAIPPDMASGE